MGKSCEVDVTDPKVAAAMTEINATFQIGYQEMLSDIGTRHYPVEQAVAFKAMREVLGKLGMTVVNSEGDYYLGVTAPAPAPLDARDWIVVRRTDEPAMKKIAAKHMGIKGNFAKLEPDGINVDGTVTFIEARGGVDISITFRFREIKPQPPESILPRRTYPPPAASRMGFEKIWRQFEEIALPLAKMSGQS